MTNTEIITIAVGVVVTILTYIWPDTFRMLFAAWVGFALAQTNK